MTITNTKLTAAGDGADASSFVTASISPGTSRLILVAVQSDILFGTPAAPTVTGCSMTWDTVKTQQWGSNSARITIFRALGTPSTGALTLDFAGVTQSSCNWAVVEFSGIDTSGSNGSGAIVQSVGNSGSSATPSVTLAAFGSGNNATYGVGGTADNTADCMTQGSGFTELYEVNTTSSFSNISIEAEFRSDNDTSVDWSISTSGNWGAIAIEIKAAATSGVSDTQAAGRARRQLLAHWR